MENQNCKKIIIVYVLAMLVKCSNKEYPITQTNISKILNSIGVECDRKTVGRNSNYLRQAGEPIVKVNNKGYYFDKTKKSICEKFQYEIGEIDEKLY